jgi:peptide/nickel transport system substrate-binding protein
MMRQEARSPSVRTADARWTSLVRTALRAAAACALAVPLLAVSPATIAHAQKQGGVLRVTHRDNPPSASIHEEATISADMPFMAVFNNLVVFDPDSKQNRLDRIVPELATSWKWSDDGRNLTFQLRDGVKWHDGKPFTSGVVMLRLVLV